MSTITYSDFFAIMKKAFEANQKLIAKCINYDESKITRMKKGVASSEKDIENIISKVLDPQKSSIPLISKHTEAECLDILKAVIEQDFENVHQGMQDCWDEKNYEKFTKKLLTRARIGTKQPEKKSKSHLKDDPAISDIILAEAFDSYDIAGYLRSDLQDVLSPPYVFALYLFLDTVKDCLTNTMLDKEATGQEEIKKLIEMLQHFLAFLLGGHTGLEKRCQDFKVPDFENTAFWDEAECMQKELLPLFETVYKEVSKNALSFREKIDNDFLDECPGQLE